MDNQEATRELSRDERAIFEKAMQNNSEELDDYESGIAANVEIDPLDTIGYSTADGYGQPIEGNQLRVEGKRDILSEEPESVIEIMQKIIAARMVLAQRGYEEAYPGDGNQENYVYAFERPTVQGELEEELRFLLDNFGKELQQTLLLVKNPVQ